MIHRNYLAGIPLASLSCSNISVRAGSGLFNPSRAKSYQYRDRPAQGIDLTP